jgi:4-hydroxybenzoate polyprenyltransferase
VEEGSGQFLPPQPAGPEPELGSRPAPPPPPQPAPAYGWQQPAQPQPDNGPAVAGFVLSIVSVSLLVLSAGLSSLISLGCAIFGIVYSRKGKRKVESGETTKNAGLAQAGFIVGIVSLCLSALATAIWVAVMVAAVSDEEFRDDLEREFDNSESIRAGLQVAAAIGRVLLT